MTSGTDAAFSARTAWARSIQTPLRDFLRTETGGAAVLLAAATVALAWVNVDSTRTTRSGRRRSRFTSALGRRALPARLGQQRA